MRRISEDSRSDLSSYQTADEIRSALIRHLMEADRMDHYGFAAFRFNDGEQFLCLRGHQLGLRGDDASLWFRFGLMKGYAPTGHIAKFQKSGETVITVYCLDDPFDTEAAARKIIYVSAVHDVLIHEITHYLDSKRNPTFFRGGKDNEDDGRAGYYNNPSEFNAYYTNLAYPLLHFLTIVDAGGSPQRLASVLKISRDFKENLEMMVRRAASQPNGAYKRFYEKLDQRNRRALMKRLYALHQQVAAKLAEPVSEAVFRAYHGTGTKFDAFSNHFMRPNFFTPDAEYAKGYTGKTASLSRLEKAKRGKDYLLTVELTINNMFDTKTDPEARRYYNEVFVPHMNAIHARFNQPPVPELQANKWVSFVYADDLWRFMKHDDVVWDGMLVDEGFEEHPAIVPFSAEQVRIVKRQILKPGASDAAA